MENIIFTETEQMIELVKEFKNTNEAFLASITMSGLTDKRIYLTCGIDGAQFTRMKNGTVHVPASIIPIFTKTVNNTVFLSRICYETGHELRAIPKALEEKIAEKDAEIEALKEKLSYWEDLAKPAISHSKKYKDVK